MTQPHFRFTSVAFTVFLLLGTAQSAFTQEKEHVAEHDTVRARRYFEKGMSYREDYNSDSASHYFHKAAILFDELGIYEGEMKALNKHGQFLMRQGKFQKSDSILKRGLSIGERFLSPSDTLTAETLYYLGGVFIELGKYDSAKILHSRSLEIRTLAYGISNIDVARSYAELGRVFVVQNDFDKALDFMESALQIKIDIDLDARELVANYNMIGTLHYFKADYTRAKEFYNKGLDVFLNQSGMEMNIYTSSILNNLGAIAFQEGDYSSAYSFYNRALSWERDQYPPDHPYLGDMYFNLAEILLEQGQLEEAVSYTERSIEISQKNFGTSHFLVSKYLVNLGSLYLRKGDLQSALKKLREALTIENELVLNHESKPLLYERFGDAFVEMEKFDSAFHYYELARKTYEEIWSERHPDVVRTLLKKAKLEEYLGAWNSAFASCMKSLTLVAKDGVEIPNSTDEIRYPTAAIEALVTYGQIAKNAFLKGTVGMDELDRSLKHLQLAIQLIQQKHILAPDMNSRSGLSEKYRYVYQEGLNLVKLLILKGSTAKYDQDAFDLMEVNKALSLTQSIRDRQDSLKFTIPDSLRLRERDLKVDIAYYQEEILNRKSSSDGYDTALVKEFEGRLLYLNRDFDKLMSQLKTKFPRYYGLKYNFATMNLASVQNRLDRRELLIEYFWLDSTLFTLAVTNDSFSIKELVVDSRLISLLDNLENAFVDSKTDLTADLYAEISHDVYTAILEPVLNSVERHPKKLIIIPDERLTSLNFDLLVNHDVINSPDWKGLPYLIEEYSISLGYSSTSLFTAKSVRKPPERNLLAFSFGENDQTVGSHLTMDVVRSSNLSDLPGSAAEVKSIADLVDGDYYFGQYASEQIFKEQAPNYQILHMAVHGSVDEKNPDYSKLHLHTEDTTEDGRLHVYELYNMELNADLAVLSACNTGSGKYQTGEGIMSLGHAFSYAGVNSLLLTRWDLSDEAAPEIMRVFYRELKNGSSKSEALRTAKLEYLENASIFRSNPFYWGSFFVLGDDSPVEFQSSSNARYYWIATIMLLLVLGLFMSKKFRRH